MLGGGPCRGTQHGGLQEPFVLGVRSHAAHSGPQRPASCFQCFWNPIFYFLNFILR